MNTDAILQAKQAVGPSRDSSIMVCMDVRYKGKISPAFGATTRSMSKSVSMTELHANAVLFVNKYWEKTHDQTLMREDTELRWHGNQPPKDKTELMSIGKFFKAHSSLPHASVYFENVTKQYGKIKGKHICLELWISEECFDSRTNADAGKKKRKANCPWNELEESDFLKRAQASGPMESSFVFGKCPKLGPTEPKDHVRLQFAKCVVVEQTGKVEIEWKDGSMDAEGDLGRKPLAQGRNKQVYTLRIDDKTYVVNQFYNIGKGDEELSVDDNASHLEADFVHVKQGAWFWECFKEEARKHNREIAMGHMQFVEPLLAKEITDDEGCPSAASNCSQNDVELSDIQAIYWLLEERRTPVVNNYSYTLNHLDQKSLKGATIVVFVHFCWLYIKQTLVFADMQGSPACNSLGNSVEVLFDPMTHSLTGCNRICVAMELDPLKAQDPENLSDMELSSDE
ncbi:hypothetical protein K439DRAFT_1612523 [Ramaria rubella]|nr:hypothetical protein K439DRAFT_1612523 [Ramaria rubella]